jgi:hypothetical protein
VRIQGEAVPGGDQQPEYIDFQRRPHDTRHISCQKKARTSLAVGRKNGAKEKWAARCERAHQLEVYGRPDAKCPTRFVVQARERGTGGDGQCMPISGLAVLTDTNRK